MGVRQLEKYSSSGTDTSPLLMDRVEDLNQSDHIINIPGTGDGPSSSQPRDRISNGSDPLQHEERLATTIETPTSQPSTSSMNRANPRNSRRGDARRRRSPLNSGLWISIELVLTLGQIVAAIVVLSLSQHEHPNAPLFAWIVGYACGCVVTLPLLYWRYYHANQALEQDSAQHRPNLNVAAGPFAFSITRTSDGEGRQPTVASPRGSQNAVSSARLKVLVEYVKMALDCFFAIWFVVGNVWIFGGHSSAAEAPNLYRLCLVFLAFSCIGYAMPFILCTTICCCLPCIISILGYREDLAQPKGATPESINALPTYKFKLKKNKNNGHSESNSGASEGGVVAAGTEKERVISGEDAVCCICLAKYANNDELRELPCSHFFHKECVDKWLKINAMCPLCKTDVGQKFSDLGANSNVLRTLSGLQDNHQRTERRIDSGLANNVL